MNPHEDYDKLVFQFMQTLRNEYAQQPFADRAVLAELDAIMAEFRELMKGPRR